MQLRPLIGERRDRGPRYLFLTIVSFAVTVMTVRVYLALSGYPKIGGGGLHVAHMLFGGLLLIVAVMVLLLFVGRRALALTAITAGIGVGLFIDEVGKFITETNDYFFAPAAPLIYGAVLLLVLLWLRVRRDDRPTATAAIQGAVEAIEDLADGRLSSAGPRPRRGPAARIGGRERRRRVGGWLAGGPCLRRHRGSARSARLARARRCPAAAPARPL